MNDVLLSPRDQRRLQVILDIEGGACSVELAAQRLQCSERQVWRLLAMYRNEGASGLVHGNRGRASTRRLSDEVRAGIVSLAQGPYAGFSDSHLVDVLALREGIVVSRASLRRLLRAAGDGPLRARRAPKHRRRRDRYPQAGQLLQVDGSPHHWLGEDRPRCALLGAIDDATSAVVGAVFREQEDAQGYFLLLRQVLLGHGIPQALYHDRHGIFRREPGVRWTLAEELAGRLEPTQFGHALEELAIASIAARSPQAKGRIERLWGTLQHRLVAELRLDGITTLAAAQAYLPAFLERHNARFAVPPDEPGSAYRPLDPTLDLDRVLSFRYARVVAHDNTVRLDGRVLQVPPGPGRRGYARAHVWVHELLDGSLGVWYEDRWLLRTPAPDQAPTLRARTHRRTITTPPPTDVAPPPERAPAVTRPTKPATGTGRRPAPDHPWRQQRIGRSASPPTDIFTDQLARAD